MTIKLRQGLLAFLLLTVTALAQSGRLPKIDVHLHASPSDPGASNPVTGKRPSAANEDEQMQTIFTEMKHYNIVKAVVSGRYPLVQRYKLGNPEGLLTGPMFPYPSPPAPPPDIKFLREEYKAGRLQVIGEIATEYSGWEPNDPRMEPYWALAEELDLPVGVHTGLGPPNSPYHGFPDFRVRLGNPLLLEDVLVRHPKLRLYIMHAGWPYLEETIAIMSEYPRVYADVAMIDWLLPRKQFHEYLRGLMNAGLGKRIMFGSDANSNWPEAIGMAVAGIESASFLSHAQRRDIFYNNAVHFLRLDETTPVNVAN
jgi:uncharacterized protein